MKTFLLALTVIACAYPAAAQTQKRLDWPSMIAVSAGILADTHSTIHGLQNGRCHEANAAFGKHPSSAKLYASSVGMIALLGTFNYVAEHAEKPSLRRISRVLNWSFAGVEGLVTVQNVQHCW